MGINPGTVQIVAQRLNHYATPGSRRKSDIMDSISEMYLKLLTDFDCLRLVNNK